MNEEMRKGKPQISELEKDLQFPHCKFELKLIDFGISSHIQIRMRDEDTGFMVGHYLYDRESYQKRWSNFAYVTEAQYITHTIAKVFGLKRKNPFAPESVEDGTPTTNKFLQGFVYWCLESTKCRSNDIDYLIARKRCGDFMRSIYAHAIEAFLNKEEPMSAIDVKLPTGVLSLSEFNAVNNLLQESNLYIKRDTRRPEHRELSKLNSDGVFYHLYYGIPTKAAVIDSGV